MSKMPNGVLVGDVALLINPVTDGDEDVSFVGGVLSFAALLWLEVLDLIPGRRRRWVLSASRSGSVIAKRTFNSRRDAEAARDRIAAAASPHLDWQAVLDAA
jgi:hypothetical protein